MLTKALLRSRAGASPVVLLEELWIAASVSERLRGLLARPPLAQHQGLWISPCNSVHSCFMGYAIDLVYLDQRQQVCGLVKELKPWRFSGRWRAAVVLELAAGQIDRLDIQRGDLLQWQV